MTTNEKIAALRQLMKERDIDMYLIPTDDFHSSEYVGEHFKARSFITGFTGSAGTAVITATEAHLWVDGRYFVQGAKQIAGTEIILEKIGEPKVPTVEEFLKANLPSGGCLGFDGRCVSARNAATYFDIATEKNGTLFSTEDLVDKIWEDRPALPQATTWLLSDEYSGETMESKIARVRQAMAAKKCNAHLISCLYDIAYLLNIRGNDIENVPVFLSFLLITEDSIILFTDTTNWPVEVMEYINEKQIKLYPYDMVYRFMNSAEMADKTILLDETVVNYSIIKQIPGSATIVDDRDPSVMMRAVKNETEIKNTKWAHVKDAVACTKAIYRIKNTKDKATLTEIDVADIFEEERRKQENFLDLSFDTIAAYGTNGAIVHYSAVKGSEARLENKGFVMVDSGAHYLEGTTDITRTIALGELTDKMKEYYTLVLRAHLLLLDAKFLKGTNGANIDMLARNPLWNSLLDYKHGTGHGVGHILNVHEGPQRIHFRATSSEAFVPGMITSDEPGIYIENEFGIRTENEVLCVPVTTNEHGEFYGFESLMYVPIDLEPVVADMLTQYEKQTLNEYHAKVRETLKPYLTDEEYDWLVKETHDIA